MQTRRAGLSRWQLNARSFVVQHLQVIERRQGLHFGGLGAPLCLLIFVCDSSHLHVSLLDAPEQAKFDFLLFLGDARLALLVQLGSLSFSLLKHLLQLLLRVLFLTPPHCLSHSKHLFVAECLEVPLSRGRLEDLQESPLALSRRQLFLEPKREIRVDLVHGVTLVSFETLKTSSCERGALVELRIFRSGRSLTQRRCQIVDFDGGLARGQQRGVALELRSLLAGSRDRPASPAL